MTSNCMQFQHEHSTVTSTTNESKPFLIPLVKCRSLYLGSSIPLETKIGMEAIQQPLRKLYGDDENSLSKLSGIDTSLTVYSSGILMTYTDDPAANTWFPIQNLLVCCAVKVTRESGFTKFVPFETIDDVGEGEPPMFAAIIRRPTGIKVLECHAFVCKSPDTALTLVQSCVHAYDHKEGHCENSPPITYLKEAAARLISSKAVPPHSCEQPIAPAPCPVPEPCPEPEPRPDPPSEKIVIVKEPAPEPEKQPLNNYFSNWQYSGMLPFMFAPNTQFHPGQEYIVNETVRIKKKKKPKHKETVIYECYKKKEAPAAPKEDELFMFFPESAPPAPKAAPAPAPAAPMYVQYVDPYAQQYADPYAQQYADPYAQEYADPYAQQYDPYAQQYADPYAQQYYDPNLQYQ